MKSVMRSIGNPEVANAEPHRKKIDLKAPTVRGQITHPGYEHVVWNAKVVAMEPPRHFAFTWLPHARG